MSKHPTDLNGVAPAEVGKQLAGLRYDALAEVLHALARQLQADSNADIDRGRPTLAMFLFHTSLHANRAAVDVQEAWRLCARFEEE